MHACQSQKPGDHDIQCFWVADSSCSWSMASQKVSRSFRKKEIWLRKKTLFKSAAAFKRPFHVVVVASFHPFFWGKKQLFSHISAAPKSYLPLTCYFSKPTFFTNNDDNDQPWTYDRPIFTLRKKKSFLDNTYLCVSRFLRKWGGPLTLSRLFCVDSTHKSVKTSICSDVLLRLCRIISRQSS